MTVPDPAEPVAPREAATVVLLRDGADGAGGVETWLLRRVPKIAFAPGMSVFPGGKVEDSDALGDAGVSAMAEQLGLSVAHAGAIVAAAIRETVEEVDVVLPPDALRPWARWITPAAEPRRYDTYFFIAGLPEGLNAAAVTSEASHADWIGVAAALAEYEAGQRPMLPPTICTLTELLPFGTVAEALAVAGQRVITPVQPQIRRAASGALVADLGNGTVLPLPAEFLTASGRKPS
ncbi:MAG TPA: NUDIX hydrolase [Jatrophihabitans sp.]